MKKLLLLLAFTAITSIGFSQQVESPCNDSLYLVLKKVPLENMSERQYNYFIQKDKECASFQSVVLQENTKNECTEVTKSYVNTYIAIVIISGILAVAIPFIMFQ